MNRIYYLHSGDLSILLDGKPYHLQKDKIYLFPQNLRFELLLRENTLVDHTFFDFFTIPAISMDHAIECDLTAVPLVGAAMAPLFEISYAYPTYPSGTRNIYSDLAESYLDSLLFLMNLHSPIGMIYDPRINTVLDYIHTHSGEDITLDMLAEMVSMEKNSLIRLFRRYMNTTPHQYIIKYRFHTALVMIKNSVPLQEVAERTGYADIAAFSHAFKKMFDISPSMIR